jgi:6-phosphogluconolactonase
MPRSLALTSPRLRSSLACAVLLFAAACATDAERPDTGPSTPRDATADAGVHTDAEPGPVDAADDAGAPDVAPGADTPGLDVIPPDAAAPDAAAPDAAAPDAAVPTGTTHVYVGSGGGDIVHYVLEPAGTLTLRERIAGGTNPSFLAFAPSLTHLYAVNEGAQGQVAAFALDATSGALTFLNRVPSEGNGPAHLAVDARGAHVIVGNYNSGTVAVLPIGRDGRLSAAVDTESPGRNAHQIVLDATGRFVLVPCLGSDYVAQFLYDDTTGQLSANTPATVPGPRGQGPRHLAIHPNARWAYTIHELGSTVMFNDFDAATGRLTAGRLISTLPAGYMGRNTTAEIVVHPSGRFVYGSNRGHDSIVAFAVDAATGALTLLGHTPTGGNTPRHFSLDPSGRFLLAANQGSGDVHVFSVDQATGALTDVGSPTRVREPAFVGAIVLP